MALWAGVFGIAHTLDSLTFLYVLSVCLFGLLGERLAQARSRARFTLALFASSPLLSSSRGTRRPRSSFSSSCSSFSTSSAGDRKEAPFSRSGGPPLRGEPFLDVPLRSPAAPPLLEAYRSADRRLARFSLPRLRGTPRRAALGYFFSPFYLRTSSRPASGFLPVSDRPPAGLTLCRVLRGRLCLSLSLLVGRGPVPSGGRGRSSGAAAPHSRSPWGWRSWPPGRWRGLPARVDGPLPGEDSGAQVVLSDEYRAGWSSLAHLDSVRW